jgi:hypothetical protein
VLVFDLAGRAVQATVQQPGLMFIAGDFARDGRLLLAGIAPGELSVWLTR